MRLSPAIRATLGTLLLVPFLSGCGLLFVEGPASGWQDASAEDLPSMAASAPCTNSKTFPMIDAVLSAANGVYGIVGFFQSDTHKGLFGSESVSYYQGRSEKELMHRSIAALIWSPVQAFSAVRGFRKVNDCRAFNVRLSEERRRGTQSQASYEWSDELFPIPDFRANALFPVRSLNPNR